jgi:hypothetical protein
MPINSTQLYIKNLLQDLQMPNGGYSLQVFITPLDPNTDASTPVLYVWPTSGDETRNPARGGTLPRAKGMGLASGFKVIEHTMDLFLVWFGDQDVPEADTWMPGFIDCIMWVLRTSPDPVTIVDEYSGTVSQLMDLGENLRYHSTVEAVSDQRYNRYDCLIMCRVAELIQS